MPHGPSGTTSWENCNDSHLIPPRGSGKQDPAGPHSLPQKLSLGAVAGSVGWVSVDFTILLAFLNTSALCSLLNSVMLSEPLLHFCLPLLSQWKYWTSFPTSGSPTPTLRASSACSNTALMTPSPNRSLRTLSTQEESLTA